MTIRFNCHSIARYIYVQYILLLLYTRDNSIQKMNYTEFADTSMTAETGAYTLYTQSGNTAVAMAACDAEPQCRSFTEYTLSGSPKYELHGTYNTNQLTTYHTPQLTDIMFVPTYTNVNTYIMLDFAQINQPNEESREDIDKKLKEIYHTPGTITANFDDNYRATMMMGTIWAMLGTAVLYLAVAL